MNAATKAKLATKPATARTVENAKATRCATTAESAIRYEAIKLVRKWQREHKQIAHLIESLLFDLNVQRSRNSLQKHLFQLVVIREILELHCETEKELLAALTQLRKGKHTELGTLTRFVEKDHEIIMNRVNQIASDWENNGDVITRGGLREEHAYLFDLFSEYWDQHEERIELAIRVFFPSYPQSQMRRFERVN